MMPTIFWLQCALCCHPQPPPPPMHSLRLDGCLLYLGRNLLLLIWLALVGVLFLSLRLLYLMGFHLSQGGHNRQIWCSPGSKDCWCASWRSRSEWRAVLLPRNCLAQRVWLVTPWTCITKPTSAAFLPGWDDHSSASWTALVLINSGCQLMVHSLESGQNCP